MPWVCIFYFLFILEWSFKFRITCKLPGHSWSQMVINTTGMHQVEQGLSTHKYHTTELQQQQSPSKTCMATPTYLPVTDDNDKGRMTTTIRDGWIGTLNRYTFYASFFSHLLLTNVPLISIFLIFQHLFRLHQFLSQRTSQLVSSGHASSVVRDTQVCFFPYFFPLPYTTYSHLWICWHLSRCEKMSKSTPTIGLALSAELLARLRQFQIHYLAWDKDLLTWIPSLTLCLSNKWDSQELDQLWWLFLLNRLWIKM